MTDDPQRDGSRQQLAIRDAVIHMANDQPLVVDLFGIPEAYSTGIVCTNVRTLDGKRPVFIDDSASTFFFPWAQVRFLEMPPSGDGPALLQAPGTASASGPRGAEPDADLEIDEDFLKRVREA
jgi:hypothetical protein